MKGQQLKEYVEWALSNFLSPLLLQNQVNILKSLPEEVKGQVTQIIQGSDKMSVDFTYLIPRISSSNLDSDSKNILLDYTDLLHVTQMLNGNSPSLRIICEKISGLKSQKINKEILYSSFSEILREEINSTETLKDLSPYVKLLNLLEEPALGYIKGLIEIQASCVVDLAKCEIVHYAEQLNAFSEFADMYDYSFNNDIILRMLNKLKEDQNLKENENQGEPADISLLDSDEDIQKALNLVRNLDLGEDTNAKISDFITFFKVKEEEKQDEEIKEEEKQDEEKKDYGKNIESENQELLTSYDGSFNPKVYDIAIKEAKNIISQLPIKEYAQITILEKVCGINIPEKHLEVFKALIKDENNNDLLVAVKCNYTENRQQSLTDQAEYMATLQNNRNFLKLYGAFWDIDDKSKKHRYSLIMEYAPETLSSRIERWEREQTPKSVREAEALVAAKELIQGMRDLNEKCISHRDLKPDNIFITKDNVYKIADFDVSKKHKKDQYGISMMISNGGITGTELYLSTELRNLRTQNKNPVHFDYNTSDVYSLGLTILRMVTNRNFGSWNCLSDMLQKMMDTTIEDEVKDDKLKDILKKMLKVDPKERPKFRLLAQEFKVIVTTLQDN